MSFTCMSKPLPADVVLGQYRVVLTKIEDGDLPVSRRSVLSIIMKDRHVFRGGTSIDDKGDTERKRYYEDLIAECKSERQQTPPPVSPIGSRPRRSRKTVARVELVGRRVIMSADVFGGDESECYHGIVVGKGRFPQHGKRYNGYKVKWHDGDEDYW